MAGPAKRQIPDTSIVSASPSQDNIMNIGEYLTEVFEILESFDYPNMIISYEPRDVAHTLFATVHDSRLNGISPMMCAIIIWSLTWNMQIIPSVKGKVKH